MKPSLTISAAVLAAMVAATSASAVSLNLGGGNGGLVNLGSSSSGGTTAAVTVDTGNVLGGSGTGLLNGNGTATATVDLNPATNGGHDAVVDLGNTLGNGGTNAIIDLGGTLGGTGNTTATVNLGSTLGNGGDDALLDLFGTTPVANVDLGRPGGTLTSPMVDLFGDDDVAAATDPTDDLFDSSGSGTGGSGTSTGVIPITGLGNSSGIRMASVDSKVKACFTPNAEQVAKLAARHAYTSATFSSWAKVTGLQIVDVGLCTGVDARIGADANVARLHTFIDSNAVLKANLRQQGRSTGDVIGIDKKGNTLVIYVS